MARSLVGIAASVRLLFLLPQKDVSDWLDAGHPIDELARLADAAPELTTDANDESVTARKDAYNGSGLWDDPPKDDEAPPEARAVPRAITLAHFIETAKAPEFLIDRLIQRGRLHTLTAATYHGKTTTLAYMFLCVAARMKFAGLHTEQGRCVLFAGENTDDTAAKFLVACRYWKLDPRDLPVTVIPAAFDLAGNIDQALAEAKAGGPVALVGIDTSAAYRADPDEDDNQASKLWGQNLRRFVDLPGRPAVIVPTHTVKNPARDNLLPRGGSGYLNEIDSNLSLWCDDTYAATPIVELHWQGKHRGPNFDPIHLEMINQDHPDFFFHDGTPVPLKVAAPAKKVSSFDGLDLATIGRIFDRLREPPAIGWCWSPDTAQRAKWRVVDVISEMAGKTPEDARKVLATWLASGMLIRGSYTTPTKNSGVNKVTLNEAMAAEMLRRGR